MIPRRTLVTIFTSYVVAPTPKERKTTTKGTENRHAGGKDEEKERRKNEGKHGSKTMT